MYKLRSACHRVVQGVVRHRVEALDVLHRAIAMRPAIHRRTRMVIKIASNLPAFYIVANYLFAHNLSYRPCYGHHKLKPS